MPYFVLTNATDHRLLEATWNSENVNWNAVCMTQQSVYKFSLKPDETVAGLKQFMLQNFWDKLVPKCYEHINKL
jgi:hypothetical protein